MEKEKYLPHEEATSEQKERRKYLLDVEGLLEKYQIPHIHIEKEIYTNGDGSYTFTTEVEYLNIDGNRVFELYHGDHPEPLSKVEDFLKAEVAIAPERTRLLPRVRKLKELTQQIGWEKSELCCSLFTMLSIQGTIDVASAHRLYFKSFVYHFTEADIAQLEETLYREKKKIDSHIADIWRKFETSNGIINTKTEHFFQQRRASRMGTMDDFTKITYTLKDGTEITEAEYQWLQSKLNELYLPTNQFRDPENNAPTEKMYPIEGIPTITIKSKRHKETRILFSGLMTEIPKNCLDLRSSTKIDITRELSDKSEVYISSHHIPVIMQYWEHRYMRATRAVYKTSKMSLIFFYCVTTLYELIKPESKDIVFGDVLQMHQMSTFYDKKQLPLIKALGDSYIGLELEKKNPSVPDKDNKGTNLPIENAVEAIKDSGKESNSEVKPPSSQTAIVLKCTPEIKSSEDALREKYELATKKCKTLLEVKNGVLYFEDVPKPVTDDETFFVGRGNNSRMRVTSRREDGITIQCCDKKNRLAGYNVFFLSNDSCYVVGRDGKSVFEVNTKTHELIKELLPANENQVQDNSSYREPETRLYYDDTPAGTSGEKVGDGRFVSLLGKLTDKQKAKPEKIAPVAPVVRETSKPVEKEKMTEELRTTLMTDLVNSRFFLDAVRAVSKPDKKASNADKISKVHARAVELRRNLNDVEQELATTNDAARARG